MYRTHFFLNDVENDLGFQNISIWNKMKSLLLSFLHHIKLWVMARLTVNPCKLHRDCGLFIAISPK
ncbi:hypothetical protein BpHYR1_012698 [Brachionus plicatilis]|uniref:Uncharacterized protein n=1 Tax=Brachionus plicatilis TaxID=10195 RepID=A0A3M7QHU6_BRAPC|nr:hypothetical protein BpHYR1_012698 [Brachionus plicatilis]